MTVRQKDDSPARIFIGFRFQAPGSSHSVTPSRTSAFGDAALPHEESRRPHR
ncbi:MAG: hypothetical protein AVDCRST_MAG12-3022 [uncultured Rubrobacteraceae bacterium]|uniref:Uncharacterized protein n=1 Tax=uncultured Rubrobacteraceae bacterium TaxID=349277 RepID=A0A6J4SW30_9ACTN|nr:MAG: hypothetical protein AVDCRST_MAG12-3022 [uncultured Rubrobacteraceae bacterium]